MIRFIEGVLVGVAVSIIGLQPIIDTVKEIVEQFRGW